MLIDYKGVEVKECASSAFTYMDKAMTSLSRKNLENGILKPRIWDQVSIICMDIVDFTQMSNSMMSEGLCNLLTRFYGRLDELSHKYNVDKVDIIGDAYIALASSAEEAVRFCLDAFVLAKCTYWDADDSSQGSIMLRCAVNTGKVTGLVIDAAAYKYTLVGEAFVTTKRLEGSAVPGRVHCSSPTVALLDDAEFHVICHSPIHPCSYSVTWASDQCKTVVCPTSLRFVSVSNDFVNMFGFKRRELLTLRMIFGPLTRDTAVQQALDQCYEFDCNTKTAVILYKRVAVPMCISIEAERDPAVLMGVIINCKVVDRVQAARVRATAAEVRV